jgi:hypothetical protein
VHVVKRATLCIEVLRPSFRKAVVSLADGDHLKVVAVRERGAALTLFEDHFEFLLSPVNHRDEDEKCENNGSDAAKRERADRGENRDERRCLRFGAADLG